MRRRKVSFSLPLLARELSDQADRARHYVVRTLFATGLLFLGFVYLTRIGPNRSEPENIISLETVRRLFNQVIELEAFGILRIHPP